MDQSQALGQRRLCSLAETDRSSLAAEGCPTCDVICRAIGYEVDLRKRSLDFDRRTATCTGLGTERNEFLCRKAYVRANCGRRPTSGLAGVRV